MDNYYSKYIKYKNKYLELKGVKDSASINNTMKQSTSINDAYYTKYIKEKGLVGGVVTKCDDVTFIQSFGRSVGWHLRNTDCDFLHLLDKLKKKLNTFTRNEFLRTNLEHPEKITVLQLRNRGFSASFLREMQFRVADLKDVFTLSELKKEGFLAREFEHGGCTLPELEAIGFTYEELLGAFDRYAFHLYELVYKDRNIQSFSSEDFCSKLHGYVNPETFRQAGISVRDLRDFAGTSAKSMKLLGFPLQKLIDAGYDTTDLIPKKYDTIRDFISNGYKITDLISNHINVSQLKKEGFTAEELKEAGITVEKLKEAGYNATELQILEFNASELKNGLFTLQQLIAVYSVTSLIEAGYKIEDLIKEQNFVDKLEKEGFTAEKLKKLGINADKLIKAKVEQNKILKLGFSAREIINAIES